MTWGYLSEFWDNVSSTTLNAWEYTESWFQNIGDAVAGAVGGLFEFINHAISDVFVFGGWFFQNLSDVISGFFAPIRYLFIFVKSFWGKMTSPAVAPEIYEDWVFDTSTLSVFQAIPYWTTLTGALIVGVLVLVGIYTLKYFLKS